VYRVARNWWHHTPTSLRFADAVIPLAVLAILYTAFVNTVPRWHREEFWNEIGILQVAEGSAALACVVAYVILRIDLTRARMGFRQIHIGGLAKDGTTVHTRRDDLVAAAELSRVLLDGEKRQGGPR
jgi:hypothetical protein